MEKVLSVLFCIKRSEPDNNGMCAVVGRITTGNSTARFGAKLKVDPRLWDSKSGRLTGKTKHAAQANDHLNKIMLSINRHYDSMVAKFGCVTAIQIKEAFQGMAAGQAMLLEYFSQFNDKFHKRIGISRAQGTWKNYVAASNSIASFIHAKYCISDIAFTALDYSFIESYEHYLRVDRACMPGTIKESTRYLRFIVKQAVSEGIIVRDPFVGYRPPRVEKKQKFLTDEELSKLMNTPLENENHYLTRDIFLIACFTGLSFIDLWNLTPDKLEKDDDGVVWIRTKRKKTGVPVNVPLLDIPLELIEKYKSSAPAGKLLPVPILQTLNKYLKIIARQCCIERQLTFHMGRHTYATEIALSHGVPIESVSSMLGHSNITSTQIYAKITNNKIDEDMTALEKRIENRYKFAL